MSFVDPYLDPKLGILKNLIGAKTKIELDQTESDIVFAQQLAINTASIARTNDLAEVKAIHKFLFGDLYAFAGKIRTVDIRKNDEDSSYFLVVSKIEFGAEFVFSELAKANYLKGLDKQDLIGKLAYFYDQLNFIHPFREGNGRVQRVFWDRVLADVGYMVDWSLVKDGENDTASKLAAETQDLSLLISMFTRIVKELV